MNEIKNLRCQNCWIVFKTIEEQEAVQSNASPMLELKLVLPSLSSSTTMSSKQTKLGDWSF